MSYIANVIAPQELTTGYGWVGSTDATAPSNPAEDPGSGFACYGRIGEDGITRSFDSDSEDIQDMFGNVIYSVRTSDSETFNWDMVDVNPTSLGIFYGPESVTGSVDAGFTIRSNSAWSVERMYVNRFIMKKTDTQVTYGLIVIPRGKLTERGDQTFVGSDVVHHEITINALPDTNGVRAYLYTSAPQAISGATGTTN